MSSAAGHLPTIGVDVAVFKEDAILLTQRDDYRVWCMPGGHIDPGETFPQAAIREVREETGYEIAIARLTGLYSRPGWGEYHILVFAAKVVGGEPCCQPGEVVDMRFFNPDALPDALLLGQRRRILDAAEGGCGVVRCENFPWPFERPLTRQEIYQLRDRSGLASDAFYRQTFGVLDTHDGAVEVWPHRGAAT